MPAESRHGEISLSDLGLRVTTSIDSHLEYGGQWIVTMENKNHLFTAEIERLVPSRITEDLRRCLRLTGVGISDISSEFVVLFFDVTFETTFPVHFIIKQSPQNIPIEILPIGTIFPQRIIWITQEVGEEKKLLTTTVWDIHRRK